MTGLPRTAGLDNPPSPHTLLQGFLQPPSEQTAGVAKALGNSLLVTPMAPQTETPRGMSRGTEQSGHQTLGKFLESFPRLRLLIGLCGQAQGQSQASESQEGSPSFG